MKRYRQRRGVVLVWVTLLITVLIGFVGLALDTAYGVLVAQQLQSGADAAALAAAAQARIGEVAARDAAVAVAAANTVAGEPLVLDRNDANAVDGDVVLGWFNRYGTPPTFTPSSSFHNAARVVARRTEDAGNPVSILFGPVFNVDTINITRDAIAMTEGNAGSGMLILDDDPDGQQGALSVGGGVSLDTTNGVAWVNSPVDNAAILSGNGVMTTGALMVNGTHSVRGGFILDAEIVQDHAGLQPDPLAWLPAPPIPTTVWDTRAVDGTPAAPVELYPGLYTRSVQVRGAAHLNPGIYYFTQGLQINSGAQVTGEYVMVYIAGGNLQMSSGSVLGLTPPDPDEYPFDDADTYEGIAVFQARNNDRTALLELSGGQSFTGTYYFPNATVNVHASGDNNLARLIAWRLSFSGISTITLDFSGNDPAAGNVPVLVE